MVGMYVTSLLINNSANNTETKTLRCKSLKSKRPLQVTS